MFEKSKNLHDLKTISLVSGTHLKGEVKRSESRTFEKQLKVRVDDCTLCSRKHFIRIKTYRTRSKQTPK